MTVRFVSPRVPLVDPKTGMITREWYLLFQSLFGVESTTGDADAVLLATATAASGAGRTQAGDVLAPLMIALADAGAQWPPMATVEPGTLRPGVGLAGGGNMGSNVNVRLADTTVVPGTYGSATQVAQITIDQQGRATAITNVAITVSAASLTGIVSPANGGTGLNNGTSTIGIAGSVTISGPYTLGLTLAGATSLILPTAGTVASLAGTETFTNKTFGDRVAVDFNGELQQSFNRSGTTTGAVYQRYTNAGGNFFFGADDSTGSSLLGVPYAFVMLAESGRPIVFGTNNTLRMTIGAGGGVDVVGEMRCDSVRIDQAATAGVFAVTHYLTISANGTVYRIPCAI